MAKPPKSIAGVRPHDAPPLQRTALDPSSSRHLNAAGSDAMMPGRDPLPRPSSSASASHIAPSSSVTVSTMPDPIAAMLESNLRAISLPAEQADRLRPSATVDGLYSDPLGQRYARLEDGVYYRAELKANGDVEIPWPSAPGVSAPLLRKIEGQPRWRLEADWYSHPPVTATWIASIPDSAQAHPPVFLAPQLSAQLTSAHDTLAGVRYDKRKKTYVDMAEGTVMVARNSEGHFQQTFASELTPSGFLVEPVPGTTLWRRKPQGVAGRQEPSSTTTRRLSRVPDERQSGTGKRQRRVETDDIHLASTPLANADWHSWGHATKPQLGDSIEIDGSHYAIVDQNGHRSDARVFIKHPQFSASDFNAFEQTLGNTPHLQPRSAVKHKGPGADGPIDTWRVDDGLPFRQTLARYVSDTFPYIGDHSASRIAHAMFNRANHAEALNGYGLNDLSETFRHWAQRSTNLSEQKASRPDLVDPLMLLPALARTGERYIPKPSVSGEGLQRIDFDLQRIPPQWRTIGDSYHISELRALFEQVLRHQGYQVSPSFRAAPAQRDALIIQRQGVDQVFIMLFPTLMQGHYLEFASRTWLRTRALTNKHDPADKTLLNKALAENNVIFLMGDLEREPHGQSRLFIFRQQ